MSIIGGGTWDIAQSMMDLGPASWLYGNPEGSWEKILMFPRKKIGDLSSIWVTVHEEGVDPGAVR